MKLVTVCITTFNRVNLILKTVESILEQTYTNFEIIIVDDCSSDGTDVFVEESILTLDKRIKYIKHTENKGLATARNTAINNAKGEYFTFCDDDDTWDDNFISLFIEQAQKYDNTYSFCVSNIANDNSVKVIHSSFKNFILLGYTPPVASQFYRTKTLKDIGGYDESITSGVDHDLWLTLGFKNYNLVWLNQSAVRVNKNENINRMTLNIDKRVNGIKRSMNIWKERIGNNFGNEFFTCFEKNYEYNTYKKFIILALKKKFFLNVWSYWYKLPKSLLLKDVIRYLKSKFKSSEVLIHATFGKCNKNSDITLNDITIIR